MRVGWRIMVRIYLNTLWDKMCAINVRSRCGRGLFQKCVSIVKTKKNVSEEDWKYVTYLVFDAPDQPVIICSPFPFWFSKVSVTRNMKIIFIIGQTTNIQSLSILISCYLRRFLGSLWRSCQVLEICHQPTKENYVCSRCWCQEMRGTRTLAKMSRWGHQTRWWRFNAS